MSQEYLSISPIQTQALGKKLAKEILKSFSSKRAVVVGLVGDLGGGKTTFLKGFAKGLGVKDKILSPTFVIMKRFQVSPARWSLLPRTQTRFNFQWFYHIDCYRIKNPKEILTLGFKEIISCPRNIVCIEWADKIKKLLPKNSLILKFKFVSENKRKIKKH